jgi:hypothetical protein
MKNRKFWLILLAISMTLYSYGQVSVTGTAYTEIVPIASVNETVQLNFGRFYPEAGGGSIIISPEGMRMANGNVRLLDGTFSQGVFLITGAEINSLNVTFPDTPLLLYHTNSINTIYLDKWTFSIPSSKPGEVYVNVGATLNFGSLESNPSGLYTGTYQVIFSYN